MKRFSDYIELLLIKHDYVIVPNFGGFILQNQSASICDSVIKAPKQVVGFNPLLQHNDGLLAMEISKNEGITYRSAQEYIEKHVDFLRAKLKISDVLQFGSLGTLKLTESGYLSFKPNLNIDFLPANFGFSDINLQEYKATTAKVSKEIRIPSKNQFQYYAAVIALFIGLFLFTPYTPKIQQVDYAQLLQMPRDFLFDSIDQEEVIAEEELPKTEKLDFHVVVAGTTNLMAAEAFCNQLRTEQFAQAHIINPVKNYHVVIHSFPNEQDAIEYMKQLRQSDNRFEDAWVLYSKNNIEKEEQ